MSYVHVFVGNDATMDAKRLEQYVLPTWSDDGDRVPSRFMSESGLGDYEPGAIERGVADGSTPLRQLLAGSSYLPLWLDQVPQMSVRYFILLFEPNTIAQTGTSLVRHVGRFAFEIPRVRQPWDG